MEIEEIIKQAVNETVSRLMDAGVIQTLQKSPEQKTEELLMKYQLFRRSDQAFTRKVLAQIDDALKTIQDDPYFQIIPAYYFERQTLEEIAFQMDVNVRTVRRNKRRFIRHLAAILFSDDVISAIYKE